jgi:hypothetical protein
MISPTALPGANKPIPECAKFQPFDNDMALVLRKYPVHFVNMPIFNGLVESSHAIISGRSWDPFSAFSWMD